MQGNSAVTLNIEYTSEFKRNLRALAKKYRSIRPDLESFIKNLKSGAVPGDQVKGVGHTIYKARIKNSDIQKGKRAGYRLIYWIKAPGNIILVTIYSKLDQNDISPKQIRQIIKRYEILATQ